MPLTAPTTQRFAHRLHAATAHPRLAAAIAAALFTGASLQQLATARPRDYDDAAATLALHDRTRYTDGCAAYPAPALDPYGCLRCHTSHRRGHPRSRSAVQGTRWANLGYSRRTGDRDGDGPRAERPDSTRRLSVLRGRLWVRNRATSGVLRYMPWLCVHPLRECRQPALERLLRLARGFFVASPPAGAGDGDWAGLMPSTDSHFCCSGRSRAQVPGLPLLQSQSDVVAVHEDAGQLAVGIGEVGEDAVVALSVQRPGAVPVRADRGELRRALRRPLRGLRCPLHMRGGRGALTPRSC